jgi:hypothetical protein
LTGNGLQIVVLGMHRSGTSALMGALDAMGMYVGSSEELTASNWENPKGFFERREVRRVCDALLHGSGADWWKLAAFKTESIPPSLRDEKVETLRRIVQNLDSNLVWAMKEPRLCVLFPLLQPLLSNPMVLHIIRHPIEVALSLQRRNGFSLQAGLALWERYNVEALEHSEATPSLRLLYSDLVSRPGAVLGRLAAELPPEVSGSLDPAAGEPTIDSSLRRNRVDEELCQLLTPSQAKLWDALAHDRKPPDFGARERSFNALQLADFERVQAAHGDQLRRVRNSSRSFA